MNLLLLTPNDNCDDHTVTLQDRRFEHIRDVLKATPGKNLSYGLLNGGIGTATVQHIDNQQVTLALDNPQTPSPPFLPLTLILALPRPKMLQRTLQTIATMGVKHLCLVHTDKVEKSFWQSPSLKPDTVLHHLHLGLEQARATCLPQISYFKTFKSLVTELAKLSQTSQKLLVHPGDFPAIQKMDGSQETVAAIGPEGGFTEQEVDTFLAHGFCGVQLGPRILRVETAVPVVIGQLF